jgi:hypothetical protein
MEDTKFSDLDPVTAVASPDFVAVVKGGVSKRADVSLFNSLKASLVLHSAANQTSVPYNFQNSGIVVYDSDNSEVFRLWSSFLSDSIFIGSSAGEATDGTHAEAQNTAIGGFTFRHNIDGTNNTAIGFQSLLANLGNSNTAIGSNALSSLETGNNNVAIGDSALQNADGISDSVGIGLSTDSDSSRSILIGSGANCSSSIGAIGIGYHAAPKGAASVAIGSGSATNADNSIVVGPGISAPATDNLSIIGNSDATDFYAGSDGQCIIHGLGDAIVFPDSDPHVAGAAYWVLGVLTRSAG